VDHALELLPLERGPGLNLRLSHGLVTDTPVAASMSGALKMST
jgi:hypothetical protein